MSLKEISTAKALSPDSVPLLNPPVTLPTISPLTLFSALPPPTLKRSTRYRHTECVLMFWGLVKFPG